MSTMNLNASTADQLIGLDPAQWTPLQTDVTMAVALAKFRAFEDQAYRVGDMVRLGLIKRVEASDLLHGAANYNSLVFEYGPDRIQQIIAAGLEAE